jgi:MarR family transcriptional regulator, 2-MHQ and catechol-resistance regulon repressor
MPYRVGAGFEKEYPGASAAAGEAFVNLLRTSSLGLAQANQQVFRRWGLSAAGAQVLAIIEGAGEPLPPGAISEQLFITSASMTSLTDTLERRGLVVRGPHPQDRRMLLLDITGAGRALLDELLPAIHAFETAAMAALTPKEQAELVRLLGLLHDHLVSRPVREEPKVRRVRSTRKAARKAPAAR